MDSVYEDLQSESIVVQDKVRNTEQGSSSLEMTKLVDLLFQAEQRNLKLQEQLNRRNQKIAFLSLRTIDLCHEFIQKSEKIDGLAHETSESQVSEDAEKKEKLLQKLEKYKKKCETYKTNLNVLENRLKAAESQISRKQVNIRKINNQLKEQEESKNEIVSEVQKKMENLMALVVEGKEKETLVESLVEVQKMMQIFKS